MGIGFWSKSLKTVDQTMIIIKEYSLGEGGGGTGALLRLVLFQPNFRVN